TPRAPPALYLRPVGGAVVGIVHLLEEVWYPADARLDRHEGQLREAIVHARQDDLAQEERHRVEPGAGEHRHLTATGPLAAGGLLLHRRLRLRRRLRARGEPDVEADRHAEPLGLGEEGIVGK